MSRSRKHSPIGGLTTARSEKKDKIMANQKTRSSIKRELRKALMEDDEEALDLLSTKSVRDYSNTYDMSKDGTRYYGDLEEETYRKFMRK